MNNLDKRSSKRAPGCRSGPVLPNANPAGDSVNDLPGEPILANPVRKWNDPAAEWRAGEFFRDLSPATIGEFESLAAPSHYKGSEAVFTEEQEACTVHFLLEGRVKLTLNSSEGRRITLGIARPGEILNLADVIAGSPYETTAVAQFPSSITALPRSVFLDFLGRHPVAGRNSTRLLYVQEKVILRRSRRITKGRCIQWGS